MELHLHVTPGSHTGHEHDILTRALVRMLECEMNKPPVECITKHDLHEFEKKIIALLDSRLGSSDEEIKKLHALAERISSIAPKTP